MAVKDAINKSSAGVQASIIQNNGTYVLTLTSTKTGADAAMSISATGTLASVFGAAGENMEVSSSASNGEFT